LTPPFTPVALDADTAKTKTMLTNFLGTTGLDVEKIAVNVTECTNRIFQINTDYLPKLNARVA
jgi:hypothetical protein